MTALVFSSLTLLLLLVQEQWDVEGTIVQPSKAIWPKIIQLSETLNNQIKIKSTESTTSLSANESEPKPWISGTSKVELLVSIAVL